MSGWVLGLTVICLNNFHTSYYQICVGNWLVDVVFWVSIPWKKLGEGWKHIKGITRKDMFLTYQKKERICFSFTLCVHFLAWLYSISCFWFRNTQLRYNLDFGGSYFQLGLRRLRDYPQPFWLALFVEGTRFTQAKLLAAQEYAVTSGLPVPKNVLIPRTKVCIKSSSFQFIICLLFIYIFTCTTIISL